MGALTTRERMLRTYRRQEIDRIPQLWDKPELIRAEMERIIPLMMEGGGYVFASDHSIPNSVSLETMKMISELAHTLGKY